MKRKKIIFYMILSLIILTGCKKPLDPKEGMINYIDTFVYNKNTENKPSHYFSDLKISSGKKFNSEELANLTDSLELNEAYQNSIKKIEQTLEKNLKQKTSYSVKIETNSKQKANVTIRIYGLKELDENNLDQIIEKKINEIEQQITENTPKEEVVKLSTSISLDSLNQWFESQEKNDSPIDVKTTLILDPNNKTKWIIQDELSFYESIVTALNSY